MQEKHNVIEPSSNSFSKGSGRFDLAVDYSALQGLIDRSPQTPGLQAQVHQGSQEAHASLSQRPGWDEQQAQAAIRQVSSEHPNL